MKKDIETKMFELNASDEQWEAIGRGLDMLSNNIRVPGFAKKLPAKVRRALETMEDYFG